MDEKLSEEPVKSGIPGIKIGDLNIYTWDQHNWTLAKREN